MSDPKFGERVSHWLRGAGTIVRVREDGFGAIIRVSWDSGEPESEGYATSFDRLVTAKVTGVERR